MLKKKLLPILAFFYSSTLLANDNWGRTPNLKEHVFNIKNGEEIPIIGRVLLNIAYQIESSVAMIIFIIGILGAVSCFSGGRLLNRSNLQDSDAERYKYRTAGFAFFLAGIAMIVFTAYIIIFQDSLGLGGVLNLNFDFERATLSYDNYDSKIY